MVVNNSHHGRNYDAQCLQCRTLSVGVYPDAAGECRNVEKQNRTAETPGAANREIVKRRHNASRHCLESTGSANGRFS